LLQVFNFAFILDRKYWIVGRTLCAAVTKEKQILSKAIQKPAQFAAVENAARVIGNAVETNLQAGCEVAPLQAGCEAGPLQAGCVQVRAPEAAPLLAGCVLDSPTVIRAKAPEEPLLAGCVNDGVVGIVAEK
jgi:hypothetical protein